MVAFIIFLYTLQANGFIIPAPCLIAAWVACAIAFICAVIKGIVS